MRLKFYKIKGSPVNWSVCIPALCLALLGCSIDRVVGVQGIGDTGSDTVTSDTSTMDTDSEDTETDSSWHTDSGYQDQCPDAIEIVVNDGFAQDTDLIFCEWIIPDIFDESQLNYGQVNLIYGNGLGDGSGARKIVGHVELEADCTGVDQGWYFDEAETPTTIVTCPKTCEWIREGLYSPLRVEIGCETEWAEFIARNR